MEKPLQHPDRLLWNDQAPYIARFERFFTETQLCDQLMLLGCDAKACNLGIRARHPRYGEYHSFEKLDAPYPDTPGTRHYLEHEIILHKDGVALLATGVLTRMIEVNGMVFCEEKQPRTRLFVSDPLARLLYNTLQRAYTT